MVVVRMNTLIKKQTPKVRFKQRHGFGLLPVSSRLAPEDETGFLLLKDAYKCTLFLFFRSLFLSFVLKLSKHIVATFFLARA